MNSRVPALRAIHGGAQEQKPREAPSEYLGPARVLERSVPLLRVQIGSEVAEARMALAFPYEPAQGDVVLVISRGGDHYVIGVLSGQGRTIFNVPGDVEIRARGGALSLSGDEGVRVSGPEVAIEAHTVRTAAETLFTRAGTFVQRVAKLLTVRAGESETFVDGAQITRAKSASLLTEGSVTLNGKQIHLG
ncbi:MAG: DUF3540 domain-containing protein [Polyangiaceae bacterium]